MGDGARLGQVQSVLIFARLNTAIDRFGGAFVEAHALDAKTAKEIPKRMIGRARTISEVAALLDRLS